MLIEFLCLLARRKRAGQIDGIFEHRVLAETAQALGLAAHRFY